MLLRSRTARRCERPREENAVGCEASSGRLDSDEAAALKVGALDRVRPGGRRDACRRGAAPAREARVDLTSAALQILFDVDTESGSRARQASASRAPFEASSAGAGAAARGRAAPRVERDLQRATDLDATSSRGVLQLCNEPGTREARTAELVSARCSRRAARRREHPARRARRCRAPRRRARRSQPALRRAPGAGEADDAAPTTTRSKRSFIAPSVRTSRALRLTSSVGTCPGTRSQTCPKDRSPICSGPRARVYAGPCPWTRSGDMSDGACLSRGLLATRSTDSPTARRARRARAVGVSRVRSVSSTSVSPIGMSSLRDGARPRRR